LSKIDRVKVKVIAVAFTTLSLFVNISSASPFELEEAAVGENLFGGYLGFVFYDDRGIGWSGSETTFVTGYKLDFGRRLYENVSVRVRGAYAQTAHEHSRAYEKLKRREFNPEDTYMEFTGLAGERSSLKLGIVKVPFGIFNTLSIEGRNRPRTMSATREWDSGIRFDKRYSSFDVALGFVNGDGREGTDPNSAKSVVIRLSAPSDGFRAYPDTQEVTGYPSPIGANPDGGLLWRAGINLYLGNRYSTPIKEKNNHYAVDLELNYSIMSIKAQATYMEGGHTFREMARSWYIGSDGWVDGFDDFVAEFMYSDAVLYDIAGFPKGVSGFIEAAVAVSARSMFSVMYEHYDPDIESGEAPLHVAKERLVLGFKHDFKKNVSFAFFHTINRDPAFGKINPDIGERYDILQSDEWKGDEVNMGVFAVEF
jgi:hypothetical protein